MALYEDVSERKQAEQVLSQSQERQAFLLRLSDVLRPLSDPSEIQHAAMKLLAEKYDVMRAGYMDVHADGDTLTMAAHFERDAIPAPPQIRLSDYGSDIAGAFRAGHTLCVRDAVAEAETEGQRAAHLAIGVLAWVIAPLVKDGRLIAIVGVVSRTPRDWTPTETQLVTDLAERTWDAVQRARSDGALRASEERLRQFGEASSDILWIREAETLHWVYLTPAFERIYGLDRATALAGDNMTGWLDLIVPEDRRRAVEAIERVRAGERVAFEYRVRRPNDGTVRWLRNTDFPMRDATGQVCWIGGVGRDVTEAKASAQRLEVLVNELQHRSRNLLGVVTAMANRTIGRGASAESFLVRLKALSRAQALLSQGGSDTVGVEALVRAELAAHADDDRLVIDGPAVTLTSQQVQNFALALHELATNAVKYGALKDGSGRLSVTWELIPTGGGPHLALNWVETGVSVPPEAATRRGYGRELIEQALAYALGGRTDYVLGEGGVRCRIELPIA